MQDIDEHIDEQHHNLHQEIENGFEERIERVHRVIVAKNAKRSDEIGTFIHAQVTGLGHK
jgi:hypothetical protein